MAQVPSTLPDTAELARQGAKFVFGYSDGNEFRKAITQMASEGYDVYLAGCTPGGRFWGVFKSFGSAPAPS